MTTEVKNRYMMSSIFDSTGKFQLDEALADTNEKDPRVDGENIIGSVQGVFFVPNGFSRNNRFYPCELWDKQLNDEDINRRLSNSIMFGCIGHSQGPVTEQDLSEGKVSHIMDKLWIDEATGMGMGKAYILNTPAGKNLRTYLKAGSNLKVSSRGEGSFAEGMEKDGHPVVEASSYNLITFDFVIEPGFTETNPQLQENYIEEVLIEKQNLTETVRKEEGMDEKLLEDLKAEKESAIKSLAECQEKHSKEIQKLQERISGLNEKLRVSAKMADRKATISESKIAKLSKMVESYSALGSVESIKKASDISKAIMHELKCYKALGTVQEMQQLARRVSMLSRELHEYRQIGSLKSLKNLLAMSERFVVLQQRQRIVAEAKELSAKSGKPIEEVAQMVKADGIESTKKSLGEGVATPEKPVDVILEVKSTPEKPVTSQDLLESLFEDSCSKLFIEEEDEKEKEVETEEGDESKEDSDETNAKDETPEEQKPETDKERLDSVEDQVDSIQSQVDALEASIDQILGDEEDGEDEPFNDYDFEIE